MKDLSHLKEDEAIPISKLPRLLGIARSVVYVMFNPGKKSVSGNLVRLQRIKSEAGWVTTRRMIEKFRTDLNR